MYSLLPWTCEYLRRPVLHQATISNCDSRKHVTISEMLLFFRSILSPSGRAVEIPYAAGLPAEQPQQSGKNGTTAALKAEDS